MSEPRFSSPLAPLLHRFRRDSRGNIAVIFALAILPIMAAIGCAVDYSLATRMKAKLQSAADAASVASISQNSIGYNAAKQMSGDGTVTAALTDATNVFNGNLNGITGYTNLSMNGTTVIKTGIKLAAKVQFSADVPVTFMTALGFQKLTVTGSSSATASFTPYLDFYLMLDVSGSMGLPSTNAEQTRLAAVNPDDFSVYPKGCTFACHFQAQGACGDGGQQYPTNNSCMGYPYTRVNQPALKALITQASTHSVKKQNNPGLPDDMISNLPSSLFLGNSRSLTYSLPAVTSCPTAGADACIQLRADAVGFALNATVAANGVDGLFATANAKQVVANQFRIGLYPFIQNLYAYFPLTSSINGSPTNSSTINYAAANLATLLDTGSNSNLGSGGTHFENAFPSMNTTITNVGDGASSSNTQPFVFLVTDGAQNAQTQWNGSWAGNNGATVMPKGASSYCKPLKDRGITVAVLYIPYQTIQNPTTVFNNEDNVANANIPNIPPSLQDCASPNFFFTANTPADITTALNAMFNKALVAAHITN
jgi:Flp pilus assembly protein TadG